MMPGDFVLGALVRNEWSVAGDDDTLNINAFLLQYFISYNFGPEWTLRTEVQLGRTHRRPTPRSPADRRAARSFGL